MIAKSNHAVLNKAELIRDFLRERYPTGLTVEKVRTIRTAEVQEWLARHGTKSSNDHIRDVMKKYAEAKETGRLREEPADVARMMRVLHDIEELSVKAGGVEPLVEMIRMYQRFSEIAGGRTAAGRET